LNKIFDLPIQGSLKDFKQANSYCKKKGFVLFHEEETGVTYEWLVSKINTRVLEKSTDQRNKMCFNLYDFNEDGLIDPSDLFRNNQFFAGLNFYINEDILKL
jgi:Ca2+-binding EF-hand superfamily protein